jgi:hypothetical protein
MAAAPGVPILPGLRPASRADGANLQLNALLVVLIDARASDYKEARRQRAGPAPGEAPPAADDARSLRKCDGRSRFGRAAIPPMGPGRR